MARRRMDVIALLLVSAGACDGPRAATPVTPAPSPSASPYVPVDVPEDKVPPKPVGAPTVADADVARIDRSLDAVRARLDALPRSDAGVPLASAAAACLEDLRAQIAAARRAAEDLRDAIRAASERGDEELVQHDLTRVRVLADRAAQLAADAGDCK